MFEKARLGRFWQIWREVVAAPNRDDASVGSIEEIGEFILEHG